MSELITLENVTAGYEGNIILSDVNFTIRQGDFIGVIGPNGGGKTTLIRIILKLIEPYSGKVNYAAETESGGIRKIGYLPQNNLIDKAFPITVKEVVLSGLQAKKGIFGRYTREDMLKMEELLQMTSVLHLKDRVIGELSGGQMQRVLLCRALITEPALLILDEPNTYVDTRFETELYALLKEINNRVAILMVSHDLGTITSHVKSIACVNRSFHLHEGNRITKEMLDNYHCPIQIVTHGKVPHTVLEEH